MGKYKFTIYNNWKRSGEFEIFSIRWCHNARYYGLTVLNFELTWAYTYTPKIK